VPRRREREAAGMPPYGRLAGIIISAGDAASAFDLGQHLARNDDAIRRRAASSTAPRLHPSRGSGVGTGCVCWSRRPRARRSRRDQPLDRRHKAAVAGAAGGGYRPAEFLLIGRSHRSKRLQAATGRIRPPAIVNECHRTVMSVSITPKPGILDIALYQGGESKLPGFVAPLKLSSNENPFGPPPSAVSAMAEAATMAHRYPIDRSQGAERRPCQRSTDSTPSGSSAGSGRTRSSRFCARPMPGRGTRCCIPSTGSGCTASGAGGGRDAGDRAGKGACRRYRGDP
jgi:hypothetical protein